MSSNHKSTFFADYFEALFDRARENCVLLFDDAGIVLRVNDAFCQCFGYSENDIVGKSASILFTKEDEKNGMFEKELAKVLSKGQASDNNYLVNKDQTITWVSGESLLVNKNDGGRVILKVVQNIHKQKESEIELRALNDFNESILGSIDDAVIVLNQKMKMLKTNRSFSGLFTENQSIPPSSNFSDFIKRYDKNGNLSDAIEDAISRQKDFSNRQFELNIIGGDKKTYDVTCQLMKTGIENNMLVILHDVTAYKQVEREREDIMGFVAHELRNPLSNVILCNEIIGESIKENKLDEVNDILERSKNNVKRLNKMIAELYDATRVNSGYLQLEVSEFNFKDIVNEAVDTVTGLQPEHHISVNGNENIQIKGDRYRLIQVITNYLSNGIKYSNDQPEVVLTVQHSKDTLTVSVTDDGLGISKTQLPYIFERFFRVEKTRNIEGIGLGLYLCLQIIQAHHGKVWVESTEGKGSTFYFSIPLGV
jgi:PAS domain S-box-containing protein